jgi:hypothetical protein
MDSEWSLLCVKCNCHSLQLNTNKSLVMFLNQSIYAIDVEHRMLQFFFTRSIDVSCVSLDLVSFAKIDQNKKKLSPFSIDMQVLLIAWCNYSTTFFQFHSLFYLLFVSLFISVEFCYILYHKIQYCVWCCYVWYV